MRILKLAVASIVVFFVLVIIIGLLFPSTVKVSRTIDIKASPGAIRHYTHHLENWKEWVAGADSSSFKVITSDDSVKSSKLYIGTYNVTILKTDAKYLATLWEGETLTEVNYLSLYYNTTDSSTTVNWMFSQKLNWYPWERFGAMMNEKIIGGPMEQSLDHLKQLVEQRHGD